MDRSFSSLFPERSLSLSTVTRMLSRIARSTARRAPAWAPRVQPRYAPARDPPLGTSLALLLGKPRTSSSLTPGIFARRAFSSYVEGEAPTSLYTLTEEEIMLKDLGQSAIAAVAIRAFSRSWLRPRRSQRTDDKSRAQSRSSRTRSLLPKWPRWTRTKRWTRLSSKASLSRA